MASKLAGQGAGRGPPDEGLSPARNKPTRHHATGSKLCIPALTIHAYLPFICQSLSSTARSPPRAFEVPCVLVHIEFFFSPPLLQLLVRGALASAGPRIDNQPWSSG